MLCVSIDQTQTIKNICKAKLKKTKTLKSLWKKTITKVVVVVGFIGGLATLVSNLQYARGLAPQPV